MGWTLHMIMCVLLCYPVSIRIYYQQGVLFLVNILIRAGTGAKKQPRVLALQQLARIGVTVRFSTYH